MSCAPQSAPLKHRLEALDGDVEMPASFYILTVLMVGIFTAVPFLYRKIWVFCFDFFYEVREAVTLASPPAGCKQFGKQGSRNLSAEFCPNAALKGPEEPDELPQTGQLTGLFVYPLKSTAPIEVPAITVGETGLTYDRLFSFAQLTTSLPDANTHEVKSQWTMVSQRTHPALSQIKTEIWLPDPNEESYDEDSEWVQNGGCLVVRFPFANDVNISKPGIQSLLSLFITKVKARDSTAEPLVEFRLPLCPCESRIKEKSYSVEAMKVWREEPDAFNVKAEISEDVLAKLKFFIGVTNPLTLFRVKEDYERNLFKCAPSVEKIGYQAKIAFHDSYPIHIQNISSIQDMESRIPKATGYVPDTRRFRANMYITGLPAYAEINATRLSIYPRDSGEGSKNSTKKLEFVIACRTPRCLLPNVNPANGSRSTKNQPFSTMSSYLIIDNGIKSPCLGMHMVPFGGAVGRTVSVGDVVSVEKAGEHFYIKDPTKEGRKEVW